MIGTLGNSLVNLYLPNSGQNDFLELTLTKLSDFAEGAVILGDDMTYTMDPTLHASRSTSQISYAALKRLKNFYAFHLVVVWRVLHLNQRDYTFFFHPHDSYTRTDLFMLSQSLLSRVVSASIDSTTFSDHAPVILDIDLLPPKQWMWRLNDSLIQTQGYGGSVQGIEKPFLS